MKVRKNLAQDEDLLDRAIIESHCIHPLIGYDIGEIKHRRIKDVLKNFPEADHMSISRKMDELDQKDTKLCQEAYKKWAERCI
jgi:hypothetical protein